MNASVTSTDACSQQTNGPGETRRKTTFLETLDHWVHLGPPQHARPSRISPAVAGPSDRRAGKSARLAVDGTILTTISGFEANSTSSHAGPAPAPRSMIRQPIRFWSFMYSWMSILSGSPQVQKKVRSFLRLHVPDFRIFVRHGSVTPNQVAPQRLLRNLRNALVSWAAFRHVLDRRMPEGSGISSQGSHGNRGSNACLIQRSPRMTIVAGSQPIQQSS